MVWIIVLLLCCLLTVESEECNNTDIIVGRLGEELEFKFLLSDLRDEYDKYITKINNINITGHNGKRIILNEIQIQDLRKESYILFKDKMDSMIEYIIYTKGNPTGLAGNLTEIFMTDDTFVVKKTKLQKEDAGIYYIDLNSQVLGKKALVIADIPTIIVRSPPNPVLKPEDNYTSTIQLECDSVSASIGDCLLSLYIVWYKNGMRLVGVNTTLSQINVTVDHNGGTFTGLVTDYTPCYQRLQTTKYYVAVTIEECNNVSESETFIIKPQYGPIEVKLEPDQREITVNKNDDLKVRCSAKCCPKCNITWEKDYQDFEFNGLVNLTENTFENDLVIENVNSSHEGVYVCLVNNIHGEVKKNFRLSTRETENKVQNIAILVVPVVIIAVVVVVVVIVIVIVVIWRLRRRKSLDRSGMVQVY